MSWAAALHLQHLYEMSPQACETHSRTVTGVSAHHTGLLMRRLWLRGRLHTCASHGREGAEGEGLCAADEAVVEAPRRGSSHLQLPDGPRQNLYRHDHCITAAPAPPCQQRGHAHGTSR